MKNEDLNFLIEALNTYRYAYLGLRGQNQEPFGEEEWAYFDKIRRILESYNFPIRNNDLPVKRPQMITYILMEQTPSDSHIIHVFASDEKAREWKETMELTIQEDERRIYRIYEYEVIE